MRNEFSLLILVTTMMDSFFISLHGYWLHFFYSSFLLSSKDDFHYHGFCLIRFFISIFRLSSLRICHAFTLSILAKMQRS